MLRDPVLLTIALEASKAPPTEFRIFAAGHIETTKGIFLFDAAAADMVMKAAADRGMDFPVDYEHAMLGFLMVDPAQSGKAAGWFTPELRNGELWATNVTWTPQGAQKLQDREFRYISPAFQRDADGRITELVNVALTNLPSTKNLDPLMASRRDAEKEHPMKTLLAALALAENVTEAAALSALNKHLEFEREVLALAGKETTAEALGVLLGHKAEAAKVADLTAKLEQLAQEKRSAEIVGLVDEAVKGGKIPPAKREEMLAIGKKDVETLKMCLAVMTPVVPTKEKVEPEGQPVTLSKEELEVAKQLRVDPKVLAERKAAKK